MEWLVVVPLCLGVGVLCAIVSIWWDELGRRPRRDEKPPTKTVQEDPVIVTKRALDLKDARRRRLALYNERLDRASVSTIDPVEEALASLRPKATAAQTSWVDDEPAWVLGDRDDG